MVLIERSIEELPGGAAVTRGRVPGDGVQLAYGAWAGAGAPLVGIHGLTASHLNFIGVAERLAGRRPLFAVDLRGRGDSEAQAPYGIEQHARDVAAAMRARRLGPSVIVGHSLGAYIACALAATAPDLVRGVVMIDGGYVGDPPRGMALEPLLDTLYPTMVERLRHTWASRGACRQSWRSLPMWSGDDWNPWLEAMVDYDLGGEAPSLRSKIHEPGVRVDFYDMARRDEVEARLRNIRAPVLVLRAQWGLLRGQPSIVGDDVVARIRRCVLADVETVAGTTHYTITLGEPGASLVAARLIEFAASLGV